MNQSANTLASALEILSPGEGWAAVCVWCLNVIDPTEQLPARRATGGGDCERCSYTGRDVFVVALIRRLHS